MAEKIKFMNMKKGPGTHFIRPTPTQHSKNLASIVVKRNNAETVIKTLELPQEKGYLYFVDKDGDVSRTLQKSKNTKSEVNVKTEPVTSAVPQKVKRRDYVALIIDNSASMRSVADSARLAFNNILASVALGESDSQEIYVSIWSFGTEIKKIQHWAPIKKVSPLKVYSPSENETRLFDAVEAALISTETPDLYLTKVVTPTPIQTPSFVVTVVTDGHNNAGNLSASDFRKIIERYQKTDRYTLTFMLPTGHKRSFCESSGVASGNVEEWDLTSAGAKKVETSTGEGFKKYWAARSTGVRSVKTFYTTDASKIDPTHLQKMVPITHQVQTFVANKEERLREFCERSTQQPLLRGAAFYQLIKDEKNVQASKLILIRDKSTKQVYSGREARVLLGLPTDADVAVKPGNHSNFDIFVQSTSVNRIIPRGTTVLYWPTAGVPYIEGKSAR